MSSTDQNKPPGKPGQRNGKPKQRAKKPDQRKSPRPEQQPDRRQEDKALIEAAVAPVETLPIIADASEGTDLIRAELASTETPSKGALVPIGVSPVAEVASVDIFLIGFQSIANAYRDCTRRSLEQTISFVEKLTLVRSPDKAIEVHSEFAKQACENFLSDSQKIWRLYGELAKQVFRPFERLLIRVTQTAR
jgi:hypothetical protein